MRIILMTDPQTLRNLAAEAEEKHYAKHSIETPRSTSGIDEILIEVVPPGDSRRDTQYFQTILDRPGNVIQISTL
jgi:hypothetical protein